MEAVNLPDLGARYDDTGETLLSHLNAIGFQPGDTNAQKHVVGVTRRVADQI